MDREGKSGYPNYSEFGTKGSVAHHHMSCWIAGSARGHKNTTNSLYRLHGIDPLQLGKGR